MNKNPSVIIVVEVWPVDGERPSRVYFTDDEKAQAFQDAVLADREDGLQGVADVTMRYVLADDAAVECWWGNLS